MPLRCSRFSWRIGIPSANDPTESLDTGNTVVAFLPVDMSENGQQRQPWAVRYIQVHSPIEKGLDGVI